MSDDSTPAGPATTATTRGHVRPQKRKAEIGRVTSAKMQKTRRVEIDRLVPHPKYGKFLKRRTVCHAHDESDATRVGDLVEIMETRPLSKTKRWRIVRVVRSAASSSIADDVKPVEA